MAGILRQLDITDEQKASLREIALKYRDEAAAIREGIPAAKENLMGAIRSEPMEEAAVREAFQEGSAIREELTVLRAKIYAEFYPFLSGEQKETLETAMAGRLAGMAERMKRRQARMDVWLGIDAVAEAEPAAQ